MKKPKIKSNGAFLGKEILKYDNTYMGGLTDGNIDPYVSRLNMSGIVVSLIAAAIRPTEWEKIYSRISTTTKCNFEIIFVGPYALNKKMPSNFHYIQTNVKPAQCVEIAARIAKGKYIVCTGDDCIYSNRCIDMMVAYMERFIFNPYICVSPAWGLPDNFDTDQFIILRDTLYCPLNGGSAMIRSCVWKALGGIDKNFMGACFDFDLMYRMYAKGGCGIIGIGCFLTEDRVGIKSRLWRTTSSHDGALLKSLWNKNGVFAYKRTREVESFSDDDILIKSQGPSLPQWS